MLRRPESPSGTKADRGRLTTREDQPSLSSRVRLGAIWSALSTLLLRLSTIVVTAVVAHILAPHDFGVFTVALTAYTVASSLGEMGIASCLIRADLDIDAMAPTMITVSVTTSVLFAGAMAASAPHIAAALGSPDGAGAVRVMALPVLINGVFAVPGAQLTRGFKQNRLFLANVVSVVPSTIVLLLLAETGSGAMAFAWSRVAAALTMGLIMFASVSKRYWPGLNRDALSVLRRFGLPLAGANFVNYILLNVDYAFVGHLLGAAALGIYVLAFNLASAPGLLLGTVINSVAMPAFSHVKHDISLLRNAMASALRAVALILMPMCGLMMVLARPLVLTLYGAKWESAAEVLSILSLYGGISITGVLFANMLTSLGKAKSTLFIQLSWLGALVPAMMLGVHRSGITGAAVAHIAVIAPVVLPAYLVVLWKATRVRLVSLGSSVLLPFLAAAAASAAARAAASLFASPLAQLVAGILAGCLLYVLVTAPKALTLLNAGQAARLRALPFFRCYDIVARRTGLPVGTRPRFTGSHRKDGKYVPRHATGTRQVAAAAMLTPAVAGESLEVGRAVTIQGRPGLALPFQSGERSSPLPSPQ